MYKLPLGTNNMMLLALNRFIQHGSKYYSYHMKHILYVRKYMMLLSKKLKLNINPRKLGYIALSHDLFKERSLDSKKNMVWRNYNIPQDTNRYVRMNLDILEKFELDEYFNTDIQLHSLSAGIFLYKEFGVKDINILYPVFFHSCPIIDIYVKLPPITKNIIDITLLSDKLSSNYLRIMDDREVMIDLNLAMFGASYKEFNYTTALYIARLISQGKSKEQQSQIATEYYFNRLNETNPLINKIISTDSVGGDKKWPKRKSIFQIL